MSLDQEALATLRGGAARPAAVVASRWVRWRGWLLGGVVLLALGGWFLQDSLRPLEVDVVAAGAPGAGEGTAVLNASGYVVARQLATVSSKVTGQVRSLNFEEGGSVAAGQVLATLDDSMARGPLEVDVVAAGAPGAGEGTAVLNASGYVVARQLATVSSKVTGQVRTLNFEEGGSVAAGQVLATLDDSMARAALEVAARQRTAARSGLAEVEVRVAEATRERDRLRQLRESGLVSESALDAAEAQAAALAARLVSARAELAVATSAVRLREQEVDELVIRAPFDGVIISKDAQPGEMISPISAGGGFTRTGIATLVDMDSREIEVDVNEAYINRVAAGQRAEAVLDAYPDWRIPARVIAIVPTADRQKATVRVRIAIEKLDPRILPDMGVKVRFLAEPRTGAVRAAVAAVPAAAVVEADGGAAVWRVIDGRARRAAVTAEAEDGGQRDILDGLAQGDRVIVGAPTGLRDGQRVRTRKAR